MSNASSSLLLPIVSIQHTFPDVIREVHEGIIPSDKFWVSCYKTAEPSVHAKVFVELDDVNRNLVQFTPKEGDVEFRGNPGNYTVECKSLNIPPTSVVLSAQDYFDPERSHPRRPQRITAFDVSPDSSRFATGFLDGSVYLYPTIPPLSTSTSSLLTSQSINTTSSKITSKPHLSSVTSLKFFPSSRVLLSSGADFSMTILPADIPSSSGSRIAPVRTLRSHSRSVTSTAIISLGRNIVSASLDSTVKLWDVPSGSVISTLSSSSPIYATTLGERILTPPDGDEVVIPMSSDERELPDTQSKVIFAGLQNGSFEVFDLGLKHCVFRSVQPNPACTIASIDYMQSDHLLATGSSNGVVTLYDTRSLEMPLTSFRRNDAGIDNLAFVSNLGADPGRHEVGLAIATVDGLPYIASIIPEGPGIAAELIGVDCDPVRQIKVRGTNQNRKKEIWSASDDAIVRKYII